MNAAEPKYQIAAADCKTPATACLRFAPTYNAKMLLEELFELFIADCSIAPQQKKAVGDRVAVEPGAEGDDKMRADYLRAARHSPSRSVARHHSLHLAILQTRQFARYTAAAQKRALT